MQRRRSAHGRITAIDGAKLTVDLILSLPKDEKAGTKKVVESFVKRV